MDTIRRRFDTNRSLRIFLLTLVVSGVVIGAAAYYAQALEPVEVAWRAVLIAALVAAGAGWMSRDRASPSQAGSGGALDTEHGPHHSPTTPGAGLSARGASLEEQGITAKVLELIALGDRYGNIFSLALVSVDYLNDIDDRYGLEVADRLLARVTGALAHTLRMPDRLGNFERGTYVVVLPETNLPGAIQIAERLRAAVAGLDARASPRVHIQTTASVGVTSFRRGDDLRGLLERAENTLRSAQKQGRNRVLPDMAA